MCVCLTGLGGYFSNPGFVSILNYIVNFYTGVDTEVRDPRGFTALIKAGLQGREECVSALLMHGEQVVEMFIYLSRVQFSCEKQLHFWQPGYDRSPLQLRGKYSYGTILI